MRNQHLFLADGAGPVFPLINGWGKTEWALWPILSSKTTLSLSGSPSTSQPTPTGFDFRQICQAFSPVAAKHRIIRHFLACTTSYPTTTTTTLPIAVLRWNEATDRQMGRWRLTAFPELKANWGRLERIWCCWIGLTWWENQYFPWICMKRETIKRFFCWESLGVLFQLRPFHLTAGCKTDWVRRAFLWKSSCNRNWAWCFLTIHNK